MHFPFYLNLWWFIADFKFHIIPCYMLAQFKGFHISFFPEDYDQQRCPEKSINSSHPSDGFMDQ